METLCVIGTACLELILPHQPVVDERIFCMCVLCAYVPEKSAVIPDGMP